MFVSRRNSKERPVTQDDMNMFLLAHKAMRRDIPALAGTVSALKPGDTTRLNALSDLFDTVYRTVKMHHTGEDDAVCPVLTEKVPSFAPHQAAIFQQHKGLMMMLKEMKGDVARLAVAEGSLFDAERSKLMPRLTALTGYVESHLRYEEGDMVSCARSCLTYKELRAMGKKSVRKSPLGDIAAALPWVLSAADDAERRAVLKEVPWGARLLYRFWWKPSYERKVRPLSAG